MKKLLSLFLALLMVFMLFPVSALADGDAAGDPSAEEVTQIAEGAQSDPEENSGETPEEKAEEDSEDETAEAGLIAFLGADSRDETLAYHYRVETAAGETVTLAPQPDFTDESALSYVWARFDAEQDTYVELPEETGAVLTLTAAAEEIGVEKLYACTVTASDAAGTAVFTLVEKTPAAENEPESEEQTAEENTPALLAATAVSGATSTTVRGALNELLDLFERYSRDVGGLTDGKRFFTTTGTNTCHQYLHSDGSCKYDSNTAVANAMYQNGYITESLRKNAASPYGNQCQGFYYFAFAFIWGKSFVTGACESKVASLTIPTYSTANCDELDLFFAKARIGDELNNTKANHPVFFVKRDTVNGKRGIWVIDCNSYYHSQTESDAILERFWPYESICSGYSGYVVNIWRPLNEYTAKYTFSDAKPAMKADMSVIDYLTYYAQSVESFSGTAKPKNSTASGYYLPTSMSDTVEIKKTYSGTITLVKKIVNHAGNTWYQTSDGYFVWSGSITIQTSPTIYNISPSSGKDAVGIKPKISFSVGWVSSNKPLSWTLEYGTDESMSTKPHSEDFTDTVLASNNPVPCSVQFGTEEPALRYNTTYYYRIVIKPTSGADVKTEIRSFSTGACNNHNLDSGTVTKQPTCSATGVKTFTCTNPGCTHTETKTIAATGNHTWNSGSVTKQPTCSATGVKTYKCTNSGCTATKTETVAATGKHTWNSGSITTQPTCVAAGVKTYKCTTSGCTATKTESVAATGNHAWDAGTVTTPATPGKAGVKTYTCTVCKQTKTESIAALPMTYTVSYDANGGSGAPAAQTKTQDVALTLSGTRPTRDGYTFLGWATSKTASSAQYQPGGTYTANAAATFYAVWEKKAPSIEEQLRAAIANGESQFDTPGDCTLSADLVVPAGFNLYVDQGTLTIPNGVTLTVESEGFLGSRSDTVVQSGGKIVNNGTLNSFMGGSITVDNGGTLENNGGFIVFGGGSFHNHGTYTPGEYGALNFEITESDYKTDLTGVDLMLVSLECWSGKEEDIRKLFAEAGNVQYVSAQISDISEATELTLSADLTIPKNGGIFMSDDAVLTVPAGKTLTNKGSICLYDNARLIIEAGAEFVNEGWVYADQTSKVSVAGRFTVAENGDSQIGVKNWECTGELNTDSGYFSLFADAANSAELEEALKSGANTVNVTGDITLDRSITVPENTTMFIYSDVTLTVPASKTLTNLGSIHVRGTLNVEGKFTGNRVDVFSEGTLTPDSIPHGTEGVLVKSIEITGADTILPGGEAEYTASITPDDAWISWAFWTIVSGDELASISYDGVLTAGSTPGTVTIRSEAVDDSGVYAEKTVTIQTAELEPDPDEPQFVVSSERAFPGKTVKVTVSILNNPGIVAAMLEISYSDKLSLVSATDSGLLNDYMFDKELASNPYKISWSDGDASVNNTENGVIATLEFLVAEDCEPSELPVRISCDFDNTCNVDLDSVSFRTVDGCVTVANYIPGDVDGDGKVTTKDSILIRRYLLGGWNITINEDAADVDKDGKITVKDSILIRRYLLGGWNIVLK